jgi:hypothetical protein
MIANLRFFPRSFDDRGASRRLLSLPRRAERFRVVLIALLIIGFAIRYRRRPR